MAHITKDRVKDTTTTTGTGNLTLSGAPPSTFRTFASIMANNDTCLYGVAHQSANEWEVGLGTYVSATPALARTTVIASSNAGAAVSFSAGTKECFITAAADYSSMLDNEKKLVFPIVGSAAVTTPAASTAALFFRDMGGRILPKWVTPSGIDQIVQPALFGNAYQMFNPTSGTTGTGINPTGVAWTSNGTVTHPTPSTTAPALANQQRRTRYANVVTTQNQQLGPRMNTVAEQSFLRGNAAGLGGFFFYTRFIVELWPAATVRIFAGLTGVSATASVCISDTVVNNTCGLWHDTTDAATTFNFVTRDAATTTKQAITLSNAIAAGNCYDFYMWCAPNASSMFWRLEDINNNVTYTNNTSTTLPTNTVFMTPQVQMSNGTANTTATTSAIGIAKIYVESDH